MKLNKKIMSLVLCGMLSLPMIGCSNQTVEENTDNQTVVEENIEGKDVVEETEEKGTESVEKPQESDIDKAYDLILPMVEESFKGQDYELRKDNKDLMLMVNITAEEVLETDYETWEYLKEEMVGASVAVEELFNVSAIKNVDFMIMVGDIDNDEFYLCASDGTVLYDAIEEAMNK